ncbi:MULTISPECIES: bestrophin family protein [Psychrobacter]|uniref:bestrophin family protein n=1 Tax=Psychrobacter TaxID=497 RepID=UPI00146E84FC|nr:MULTISPECIES: bestrophin family ion channel [Psychrobacter]
MIVRQKLSAFTLFFALRGSVLPNTYPQIILITAISALVTWIQHEFPSSFSGFSTAPFTLLGIALSLFLGFRNNASYQRWWEARGLWGQLVFDSRSFTRQIMSFIDDRSEEGRQAQKEMVYLNIAFVHALRHRLRDSEPWEDVDKFVEEKYHQQMRESKNLPDFIMRLLGKKLSNSRKKRLVTELMMQNIDQQLSSITIVLAACERIQNTPLPFAYMLLVHRTTYLYCFMLPFGLASSLGWATPLICALVAYTFFGLDALSEELVDPFGFEANHLPLEALSRTIEINLLEALNESNLPPPVMPVKGCLQ